MATRRKQVTLAETREAIARLREEIELKIHLAKMDTRDAWASLLPDIRAIENDLKSFSQPRAEPRASDILFDEAKLQTHLALMNARDAWEKIEPKIAPIVDHIAQAGQAVVEAIRTTEEQGAVKGKHRAAKRAAMQKKIEKEAKARRKKVRAELARAQASIEAAANDALGQIRLGIESLRDSFSRPSSTKTATKPHTAHHKKAA
ncbi:MAG TPA: hypothetical protein VMV18_15090 [bacterium]|nr:hypothetical protein [bacterium]